MGMEKEISVALLTALGLAGCSESPQTLAQIISEQTREDLFGQFDQACGGFGAAMDELRRLQGLVAQGKTPDERDLDSAAQKVQESEDVMSRIVGTRSEIERAQRLSSEEWHCGKDDDSGKWVVSRSRNLAGEWGNSVQKWIQRMR